MDMETTLRAKYEALAPVLNERTRRLRASADASPGAWWHCRSGPCDGLSRTRDRRAPDDSPLRGRRKSVRKLAAELQALGHSVSPRLVNGLLHEPGYTLQASRGGFAPGSRPMRGQQRPETAIACSPISP